MNCSSQQKSIQVMIITETWLHSVILDASMKLADCTTHHSDRIADFGKSRGGSANTLTITGV